MTVGTLLNNYILAHIKLIHTVIKYFGTNMKLSLPEYMDALTTIIQRNSITTIKDTYNIIILS